MTRLYLDITLCSHQILNKNVQSGCRLNQSINLSLFITVYAWLELDAVYYDCRRGKSTNKTTFFLFVFFTITTHLVKCICQYIVLLTCNMHVEDFACSVPVTSLSNKLQAVFLFVFFSFLSFFISDAILCTSHRFIINSSHQRLGELSGGWIIRGAGLNLEQ